MQGTPINDLYQMENKALQYNAMQGMQGELAHNAASNVFQAQHAPYYDSNEYMGENRGFNPEPPQVHMEDLSKDINENLDPNYQTTQIPFIQDTEYFDELSPSNPFSYIPVQLREPLLLLIVFIILSQPIVRNNIAKYIKYINCDDDGNVPFTGILIYGLILVTIFIMAKKYVL